MDNNIDSYLKIEKESDFSLDTFFPQSLLTEIANCDRNDIESNRRVFEASSQLMRAIIPCLVSFILHLNAEGIKEEESILVQWCKLKGLFMKNTKDELISAIVQICIKNSQKNKLDYQQTQTFSVQRQDSIQSLDSEIEGLLVGL